MEIIHVDRPLWYPASQLTTFIYLFAAIPLARRSSDTRIVAALPIIGNAAVASYAVFNMLRVLEAVGYVPRTGGAVAAGLAESIFPLCLGAGFAAATSLLIAFNPGLADARTRRTSVGSFALILAAAGISALAAFSWYLWPGTNYAELTNLARLPLIVAAIGLTVAVAALIWPRRGFAKSGSTRWFVAFGLAAALAACLLWIAGDKLVAVAWAV